MIPLQMFMDGSPNQLAIVRGAGINVGMYVG